MRPTSYAPHLSIALLAAAVTACGGASSTAPTAPTPDSATAAPMAPATPPAAPTTAPRSTPAAPAGADLNAPLPPLPARPAPSPPPAACTERGCVDGYALQLTAQRWTATEHVVALALDGVAVTCKGSLHLRPGEGSMLTCDRGDVDGHHFVGDAGTGTLTLFMRGAPRRITVDVSAGTTLLTHQDLVPTYTWVLPNGPGCGGECLQAHDDLTM